MSLPIHASKPADYYRNPVVRYLWDIHSFAVENTDQIDGDDTDPLFQLIWTKAQVRCSEMVDAVRWLHQTAEASQLLADMAASQNKLDDVSADYTFPGDLVMQMRNHDDLIGELVDVFRRRQQHHG